MERNKKLLLVIEEIRKTAQKHKNKKASSHNKAGEVENLRHK